MSDNRMVQPQSSKEGYVPFNPDRAPNCSTYYKVVGDLAAGETPVIMVHGGPGGGHEYLLPFSKLWETYGIPVIFYDQIGCGKSSLVKELDGDRTFWTMDLFVKELENLVHHLELDSGYHLLGQSWGGQIAPSLAGKRPRGLKRMVLASGIASQRLSQQGYLLQTEMLSKDDHDAIQGALKTRDFKSEGYNTAMDHYRRKFMCRSDPFPPPELLPALGNLAASTTWATMYGDSLFDLNGSLADWSVIPDLHLIQAPTLVYNGEFDTSHDLCTAPFFDNIPRVRWFQFAGAGHMIHLESEERREKCLKLVGEFLKGKGED